MKTQGRALVTLLVVAGLVLGVAACGTPAPTEAPTQPPDAAQPTAAPTQPPKEQPLPIGVLIPLSGFSARIAEEQKDAIEMAFEEINYQIGPYKVELVWIDTHSGDPAKAAQAYEQAIVEKKIVAGIMNWHSSEAVACMEISAKYKLPHFFGFGATEVVNEKYKSDPAKYSYWMGKTWPSPSKLSVAYVTALEDAIAAGKWTPKQKTIYLLAEDTDFGRSYNKAFRSQFENAGWKVVGEEYFTGGLTEFYPLLAKVSQLKPGVVTQVTGGAETLSAYTKQAAELGVSKESLMIIDGLGWVGEWYDLTGDASNYVLDSVPEFATQKALEWAAKFKAKYNLEPSAAAGGQTYDMTKFFIIVANRALEKHGEITSASLYEVGQSELWTGKLVYDTGLVHAKYEYNAESVPDPVVGKGYFIFPVRQYMNGKSTIIWPGDWATGELQAPQP